MVSFTPTEEQQLLVDTINRYAINDVRKAAHEADENSTPPLNVVKMGWQIGLVPSGIPEELGGFGELSAVTGALAAEELAFGDLSVAMHISGRVEDRGVLALVVQFGDQPLFIEGIDRMLADL